MPMFGRRVPPHIVFTSSVVLAALCMVWAGIAVRAQSWIWVAVAVILAVWFAVDAYRSYFWNQNKKRTDLEKKAGRR